MIRTSFLLIWGLGSRREDVTCPVERPLFPPAAEGAWITSAPLGHLQTEPPSLLRKPNQEIKHSPSAESAGSRAQPLAQDGRLSPCQSEAQAVAQVTSFRAPESGQRASLSYTFCWCGSRRLSRKSWQQVQMSMFKEGSR